MNGGNANPFETSWADQWDYGGSDPAPATKKQSAKDKYGKKVGEGFDKTKAVAATGMKKVKEGTLTGFHWVKDKYQKSRNPHKH
ncbi:hypothetical protein H6P81_009475 [Aristolochia fimbriata]|uniref:Uncharacterized protein n=1 Tax=Aristolochia fimbriata TaxID=158543 RepID=A0AAV7EKZ4_ARIFI|nr:hypothetical protein H6P81_009475 [Aristolochia fimbriata]